MAQNYLKEILQVLIMWTGAGVNKALVVEPAASGWFRHRQQDVSCGTDDELLSVNLQ